MVSGVLGFLNVGVVLVLLEGFKLVLKECILNEIKEKIKGVFI